MKTVKMEHHLTLEQVQKSILSECIACGSCVEECFLLQKIGETPDLVAKRGPTTEEAFSCFLCSLCLQACPFALDIGQMFNLKRTEALNNNELNASDYCYLFPDQKINSMSLYRKLSGITYEELSLDLPAPVAFFPGCTMLTYAPKLIDASFACLEKEYRTITMLTDCCGLPLRQFGLQERSRAFIESLEKKLKQMQINTLITACPNCYYELREQLANSHIKIKTIYEILQEIPIAGWHSRFIPIDSLVAIHDSCHDRHEGIFGRQVRAALKKAGYKLVEMEHSFERAICCGSGGQVTHFQPELATGNVQCRLEEAKEVGAKTLVSYCTACVLNFAMYSEKIESKHALNLILDVDENFSGVKEKSRAMFTGPEGEKNWALLFENQIVL